MSTSIPYGGSELELFFDAVTWKRYWFSFLMPFLDGDVLEVGAGLGATLPLVPANSSRRWVCLEPDMTLCARLHEEVHRLNLHRKCQVVNGTLADLPRSDGFDAILYLDVLEHIGDDAGELRRTAMFLRPGGALVVLAPAHPWLYTPFDRAIGHHRRYTKKSLRNVVPPGLTEHMLMYLDSVGLSASIANRLLLRQSVPTRRQILFWDRVLVRISKGADRALRYRIGKSLLGIWRKSAS
jgi:SAM-dependent methyltransferase